MPTLFALVAFSFFSSGAGGYSGWPSRLGVYQSYKQCVQQAHVIEDQSRDVHAICIAVNG